MKKEVWIQEVSNSISRLSRTSKGVSDTSSSVDKPSLKANKEEELACRARQNLISALEYVWENRSNNFQSSDNIKLFINEVARRISEGLLQPGQSLFRTWDTEFQQAKAAGIGQGYEKICRWLFGALQTENFIETAALVEKRLDGEIHPFADGCGRTAKCISAYVLLKIDCIPLYRSRAEYYREINGNDYEWIDYYRSLVSELSV